MGVYCFKCDKIFSNQSSLNRHQKEVHKTDASIGFGYDFFAGNFKCLEGCHISFKRNDDLRSHLTHEHDIPQEIFTKLFVSIEGK